MMTLSVGSRVLLTMRHAVRYYFVICVCTFAFVAFDASFCAGGQQLTAAEFDMTVAPVLARHCLSCHNSSDPKGGLDLTRSETLIAGGDSGPVIIDRNPDESPLYLRVASGEMPPPAVLLGVWDCPT